MPKYGQTSYIDKLEAAAGISQPKQPVTPPAPRVAASRPLPSKLKRGKMYSLSGIPLIPRAKGGSVSPSSKLMKTRGMPLAGFKPGKKKAKKRFPI